MSSLEIFGGEHEPMRRPITGGHMLYDRFVIDDGDGPRFVKTHQPERFTDPERERHSREYLKKEHILYQHLATEDFEHIPQNVAHADGVLSMEPLEDHDGWHWRSPAREHDKYVRDILAALRALESIMPPPSFHDSGAPSYETHIREGWDSLLGRDRTGIQRHMDMNIPSLRPEFVYTAIELRERADDLRASWAEHVPSDRPLFLMHHDARQANIAWHPERGVRLVDWSWAGVGEHNSDSTMFLIDLHKSGVSVLSYLDEYGNAAAAFTQIGFLLEHSMWPARSPHDAATRRGQFISAVSAYDIWRTLR